ncbi:MAG: L,D-transpeptidase, partial [Myxococcota bacterium]
IRHWTPSPARPDGAGPTDTWVDVDLDQQALTVYAGDEPVYFTVVSTGVSERRTPTGAYRLQSKAALDTMESRPGAEDWYRVEDVPWTMFFRRYYALHGAYWHWGFGHPASHGCVNLAPRDAAWLFDHLAPAVPDGWTAITARPDEGAVIRIRD